MSYMWVVYVCYVFVWGWWAHVVMCVQWVGGCVLFDESILAEAETHISDGVLPTPAGVRP